jgi:hypothetical protein
MTLNRVVACIFTSQCLDPNLIDNILHRLWKLWGQVLYLNILTESVNWLGQLLEQIGNAFYIAIFSI